MIVKLFPEIFLILNEEVQHHPLLQQRLNKHGQGEFEIKFAEVAAYCNVAMDDWYSQKDFESIGELLLDRLQRMRVKAALIIPGEDYSRYFQAPNKTQ